MFFCSDIAFDIIFNFCFNHPKITITFIYSTLNIFIDPKKKNLTHFPNVVPYYRDINQFPLKSIPFQSQNHEHYLIKPNPLQLSDICRSSRFQLKIITSPYYYIALQQSHTQTPHVDALCHLVALASLFCQAVFRNTTTTKVIKIAW